MLIGLLRTILLIIIFYYIFKFLFKYVVPFLFGSSISGNKHQKRNNYTRGSKKEGEITIDYIPKKNKKIDKETGDYIEYEEVDK